MKETIAVTGSNGQLGQELRQLVTAYPDFNLVFTTREELPVEDRESVFSFLSELRPSVLINCAAYTAVDKAETDSDTAFAVNSEGVSNLAEGTARFNCKLLHVSTDYVFDGTSPVPYRESDPTNPVNVYGASKLEGEKKCIESNPDAVIIRTAWVYSEFGNNFVKTMVRLMNSKPEVNVVSDQIGAPTYAADLAEAIMKIIVSGIWVPGIYHYSNAGRISWHEFAVAIKSAIASSTNVNPIPTSDYPTPAKRPSFSLLDTEKIRSTYNLEIPHWEESLHVCLKNLKQVQ